MRKRPNSCIILALATMLVGGCEKVIEPKDLPEQDPRLVVNCLLYADQNVQANITSSKSILSGKPFKALDNAICKLYEDDRFVEQLVNSQNGDYGSAYVVKAGKKYRLNVHADGFEEAEGSTIIPSAAQGLRFERYDTLNYTFSRYVQSNSASYLGGEQRYKVWILDDVTTKNYYGLEAVIVITDSAGNALDLQLNGYIRSNSNEDNVTSTGSTIETNDEVLVNGRERFLDVGIGFYHSEYTESNAHSVFVWLYVSNISEDLYRYTRTVHQQASAGASFFSEPVLVHNNIQNGMGIIGGLNRGNGFLLYSGQFNKQ